MKSKFITNSRGQKLFIQEQQATNAKCNLALVHGIGEHIGRYDHVFEHFSKAGISVFGLDSIGNGKSDGKRGHSNGRMDWNEEIGLLLDQSEVLNPDLPTVLYGHSLGGNKVLNYVLNGYGNVDAVIATSPFIREGIPAPKIKVAIGRALASLLPSATLDSGLPKNKLSRVMEVNDAYYADPLVHPKVSLAMAKDSLDAAAFLDKYDGAFPLPLLIVHGSDDVITSYDGSKQFAERVIGNVEFKSWPNLWHETHNELNKEEVLNYHISWIERNLY